MAHENYVRLSAQDSSFVMFEGAVTHMHVSAVAIFEMDEASREHGSIDIERLRAYVASRLPVLLRYRQRLAFTPIQRHPIWVDDDRFNLAYHVRHTGLPAPGSEEQLKDLAGRIMSQQLDRTKPLWETWFVDGLEGGRFAMISKVHHCMVDGASGVGLMQAMLSPSPDEDFDAAPTWVPRPRPGKFELLIDEAVRRMQQPPAAAFQAVKRALERPSETSTRVAENARAMWQALNTGLRAPANTPLNRPIGTHRRVEWCSVDLADIKDVKKRLDGTVNDVVLTIVSGAMRRFLRQRRVALAGLDFRVVVPVNMRKGPDDMDAANRVSAIFLSLPIDEKDPLRQFQRIRTETSRLKDSKAAHGIDLFNRFTEWTRSDLLTYWGTRLANTFRPHNMIVTNVAGPQFPLYLLGSRLEVMYPQLPLFENQGLGVAVMSYSGKVSFGLIADWDLVPDLGSFGRALVAAFRELRDAAEKADVSGT